MAKGHFLLALPSSGNKYSSPREGFWAGPQDMCTTQKTNILRISIIKTNF